MRCASNGALKLSDCVSSTFLSVSPDETLEEYGVEGGGSDLYRKHLARFQLHFSLTYDEETMTFYASKWDFKALKLFSSNMNVRRGLWV